MSLIWECCKNQSDNEKNVLANTLPPGYDCKVTFYQLNEILENEVESQFKALVKVKLGDCSVDSVNSFLEDFYSNTNTTFNKLNADVEKVPDDDGKFAPTHRVIYSGTRKCQHRVRKKPSPTTNATRKDCVKEKNTNCNSRIRFSLKNHDHQENCSEYALEFEIDNTHNHVIKAADAMRFHPVAPDTKKKYLELFLEGLTAMECYHRYRSTLTEDSLNI